MKRRKKRRINRKASKRRRFLNPYKEKQRISKKRVLHYIKILLIFLFISAIITFFVGPFMELEGFEIDGNITISEQDIRSTTNEYLAKKHFGISRNKTYNLSTKRLQKLLLETYPMEQVSISVKNGYMSIHVKEDITEVAWKTNNTWYLLNLEGIVLRQALDSEAIILSHLENREPIPEDIENKTLQNNVPMIIDSLNNKISISDPVLTSISSSQLITFARKIKQLDVDIYYFVTEGINPFWIKAISNKPYEILIDGAGDVNEQLHNFAAIISDDMVNEDLLTSVDLRFNDHIYIKQRKEINAE